MQELIEDIDSHVSTFISSPLSTSAISSISSAAGNDGSDSGNNTKSDGSDSQQLTPNNSTRRPVLHRLRAFLFRWKKQVLRRCSRLKKTRVVKYGKWLLVQLLLFTINFCQNEIVSRSSMFVYIYMHVNNY